MSKESKGKGGTGKKAPQKNLKEKRTEKANKRADKNKEESDDLKNK